MLPRFLFILILSSLQLWSSAQIDPAKLDSLKEAIASQSRKTRLEQERFLRWQDSVQKAHAVKTKGPQSSPAYAAERDNESRRTTVIVILSILILLLAAIAARRRRRR